MNPLAILSVYLSLLKAEISVSKEEDRAAVQISENSHDGRFGATACVT